MSDRDFAIKCERTLHMSSVMGSIGNVVLAMQFPTRDIHKMDHNFPRLGILNDPCGMYLLPAYHHGLSHCPILVRHSDPAPHSHAVRTDQSNLTTECINYRCT